MVKISGSVDWSPEELAERLTFAGLSVEQVPILIMALKCNRC